MAPLAASSDSWRRWLPQVTNGAAGCLKSQPSPNDVRRAGVARSTLKTSQIRGATFQRHCGMNGTPAMLIQYTSVFPYACLDSILGAPLVAILSVEYGAGARKWDAERSEETFHNRKQLVWLYSDVVGAADRPLPDYDRRVWNHDFHADVNEVRADRLQRRVAFCLVHLCRLQDAFASDAWLSDFVAPFSPWIKGERKPGAYAIIFARICGLANHVKRFPKWSCR